MWLNTISQMTIYEMNFVLQFHHSFPLSHSHYVKTCYGKSVKKEKRKKMSLCYLFCFSFYSSLFITCYATKQVNRSFRPSVHLYLSVRLLVLKSPVHFSAFSVFFLCKKSDFFERGKSCKQHVSTYHKSLCPLLCLLDDRFK